jgi:drug/metabolite transporter (DMT)-like permease
MPGHEYTAIGIASIGATSAILAALILKERVSAAHWGGIALIVGGVAGVSAG